MYLTEFHAALCGSVSVRMRPMSKETSHSSLPPGVNSLSLHVIGDGLYIPSRLSYVSGSPSSMQKLVKYFVVAHHSSVSNGCIDGSSGRRQLYLPPVLALMSAARSTVRQHASIPSLPQRGVVQGLKLCHDSYYPQLSRLNRTIGTE